MPTSLITLLAVGSILFVLRRDMANGNARPALWIPVLWLSITGSRFVSQWIDMGASDDQNYTEGSIVDALYFGSLIAAGLWVLARRHVSLGEVVRQNFWLALLVTYGFMSILWSEDPVVGFKRWVKAMGHPVMALLILSEPRPIDALATVLKRCAYVLLPLSVLFIKYLPEYGRGWDAWTGQAFNTGVTLSKNNLGYVCMVLAIFYLWHMPLVMRRGPDGKRQWTEIAMTAIFLWMALWLLVICDSATSLATAMFGAAIAYLLGTSLVSKRYFGTWVVAVVVVVVSVEAAFDVYEEAIALLGRDPTLTDRTLLWADVLALQDRPILGYGFESFWLGSRLEILWSKWWWRPNQAHNGYIETYLNQGIVGVALLVVVIFSVFRKITLSFDSDLELARLRMGLLLAILAYNYTEATFKGVHFIWTIFFILAMDYRQGFTVHATQEEGREALRST